MSCNHIFIGISGGVRCKNCGTFLTADEYRQKSKPPAAEKKVSTRRRKEVQGRD